MNAIARALSLLAVLLFAAPASATCLHMESPPVGTAYGVGAVLPIPGANVRFRPFQWAGGLWTAAGTATIVASNHANGSPVQEMNLNNINLSVAPKKGANQVTFNYADFGGNVNLAVNGVLVNRADLSFVPAVIGGANVTVTRVGMFGFHFGTVTMTGNIMQFALGGQEFFADDVCW